MTNLSLPVLLCLLLNFWSLLGFAEGNRELQVAIAQAEALAALPKVVEAVKVANQNESAERQKMTQAKWEHLAVSDKFIQDLIHNPTSDLLREKAEPYISELFLSASDGTKVSFFQKTTNWKHKGKPKHDQPLAGQVWVGKLERDDSSGVFQIQIGVPVLDHGKPIGSLVIGVAIVKYEKFLAQEKKKK